eukprot:TRINITY_DN11512_c0_g1_i2.p1 TRINITY_DN11512_c0_g1~~TRINITY_DN11512_c0_g1_i2.p1  ORF type:complete len:176 (+),score=11.02 TRINITY_DN11512_c0_g1_i2:39-530(+)
MPPISSTAFHGYPEIASILLEVNPDMMNDKNRPLKPTVPLAVAVMREYANRKILPGKHLEICKMLLENDYRQLLIESRTTKLRPKERKTALQIAVENGLVPVVMLGLAELQQRGELGKADSYEFLVDRLNIWHAGCAPRGVRNDECRHDEMRQIFKTWVQRAN